MGPLTEDALRDPLWWFGSSGRRWFAWRRQAQELMERLAEREEAGARVETRRRAQLGDSLLVGLRQ